MRTNNYICGSLTILTGIIGCITIVGIMIGFPLILAGLNEISDGKITHNKFYDRF